MNSAAHSIYVKEIELTDGSSISLEKDSIVVVTGSNNAGKSTFLDEVNRQFRRWGRQSYNGRIISSTKKVVEGDPTTIFDFLAEKFSVEKSDPDSLNLGYSKRYKRSMVEKRWAEGEPHDGIEEEFLETIGLSNRIGTHDRNSDSVEKIAEDLFYDEQKEKEISRVFKRAFGKDIILQRERSGGIFKLGNRSKLPKHDKRLTPDFRKFMDGLEDVFVQGAGMRSFARIAIQILTTWRSVVIIDEPELFLHPPQAKQMARLIASDFASDRQIFLATHNETFLRNIFDFGEDRVVVLRLDRKISRTHVRTLKTDEIIEFWSDPLLRTSNIISALFHDAVIVCEGESDVRFFETLMDAVYGQENLPDTAYFSCNGKAKMKSVIAAVENLGIQSIAICDLDMLMLKSDILRLYELKGGKASDIEDDLNIFHRAIDEDRFSPKFRTVRAEISEALDGLHEDKPVPASTISSLRKIVESGSAWSQLKLSGINSLKSNKGLNAARRVVAQCLKVGIIINDYGELESLCRAVDSERKADWLGEVLKKDLANDPDLEAARNIAVAVKSKLPRVRR